MKILTAPRTVLLLCIALYSYTAKAQAPINWTADQLIQPASLAKSIADKSNIPVIFCVGPGAVIPGSINIGPGQKAENIASFKKALDSLPKDAAIVIYCGCCPFEHCPNVRP